MTKEKMKGIMAMLEQFKHIEREQVQSLIITPKLKPIIELSRDLDKIVAELTDEFDVEALLAERSEFIREDEYSENLLDDLHNTDDLLNELQDNPAIVAIMGIIPLKFADQAGDCQYLEGDVVAEEVECAAFVRGEHEEIRFKKWTKVRHPRPLYIRAHINGKPVSKVLINREAVLNVMPFSTIKRLGKNHKDLKQTNMTISNFTRGCTPALGFFYF